MKAYAVCLPDRLAVLTVLFQTIRFVFNERNGSVLKRCLFRGRLF